MAVHNTTFYYFLEGVYFRFFFGWKPYMLASVGQPSLHGHDVWFFGLMGHSGEIAG